MADDPDIPWLEKYKREGERPKRLERLEIHIKSIRNPLKSLGFQMFSAVLFSAVLRCDVSLLTTGETPKLKSSS